MTVLLYAGLFGLMMLALAYNVIIRRWRYKIGIGSGENRAMEKAIRVHGNFAEFVPLALFLIFLAEYSGSPGWLVHVMGLMLLAGRGLHVWGLSSTAGVSIGRMGGTIITHLVYVAAAVTCLTHYFIR